MLRSQPVPEQDSKVWPSLWTHSSGQHQRLGLKAGLCVFGKYSALRLFYQVWSHMCFKQTASGRALYWQHLNRDVPADLQGPLG